MAFNADRKFDRLLELMNKIGRTSESFERRAEQLENSRISYDASTDPEYLRGKRKRQEAAELQVDVIRGNDSESTRGYDNSWNNTQIKTVQEGQAENEEEIQKQMRQQKIAAFEQDKQQRLQRLKNRFAQVRYQEIYDLNKAAEDYNFTVDWNYRRQQERQKLKDKRA